MRAAVAALLAALCAAAWLLAGARPFPAGGSGYSGYSAADVAASYGRMFGVSNVRVAGRGEPLDASKVVVVADGPAVTDVHIPPQWSLSAPAWK